MKKHLMKLIVCLLVLLTLFSPISASAAQNMQDENELVRQELEEQNPKIMQISGFSAMLATTTYYTKTANADGTFTLIESYASFNAALSAMNASTDPNIVVTSSAKTYNGGVVAMKDGIAVSVPSSSTLLIYMPGTNTKYTYISPSHVLFYYSTVSELRVRVGISGYIGEANNSELMLIPRIQVKGQSYYYADSDRDIIHKIATISPSSRTPSYASYTYLKAPSFMTTSIKYYSLDGRTFYKDPQLKQKAGTITNYYNILPVRSKTKYTASELNYYISLLNKSDSVLNGQAQTFIDAQNSYGVNAALLLSIAFLESAYGTSNYAKTRYNLFGLNAGDANPDNASYYSSVKACVDIMASKWISQGYCDANTDFRYFGANLGNKQQGFNVYYASDPYWGQKIAGLYYKIDRKLGYKDQYSYNIGVTNTPDYVYYSPGGTSVMYRLAMKNNTYPIGIPVIILDDSNPVYYKIQSDMPINDSGVTDCYDHSYNFAKDVGYVKKTSVNITGPTTIIDKTYLTELITAANAADRSKYTEQSLSVLDAALSAAIEVRDNASATQQQVNKAYDDLNSAYNSLVLYVAATDIVLNKTSINITQSLDPIQLEAAVIPANASYKNIIWSSNDEKVAIVSNTGLVTPLANGTVTITAKSADTRVDIKSTCAITINLSAIGSSVYKIDSPGMTIYDVEQNTSVENFLQKVVLPSAHTSGVYSSDMPITSGIVKTGMVFKLFSGDKIVNTFTISVKGDLNKDGIVSISDLIAVKAYLLNKSSLDGAVRISGDLNGDSNVSISDFIIIKAMLLGK